VVTPVGQVFAMCGGNQGGQALRTIFSGPTVEYDRDGRGIDFVASPGTDINGCQPARE